VEHTFLLATSTVSLRSTTFVAEGEDAMPNDRRIPAARDRTRINASEESEVEYWAKALGVSRERLVETIKKVGDSVQAVRTELSNTR
jgi:hypothetical protein